MNQLANLKLPYSVLDLCPLTLGSTATDTFQKSAELAKLAESLGYKRFWVAEHHNIPSVASSATSVVIAHIASQTSSIRVGAGGIMLSNHSPLVIAEQFGTLESLFPGRIDLGLGRAPGGDRSVMRALRRNLASSADSFDQELAELRSYFDGSGSGPRAIPGEGLELPIYLLGSSDYSARLAAHEGLPFAFASHFAPDQLMVALNIYRSTFKPSKVLSKPHVIVGVNVFAADSDSEARKLFTTVQQAFLNMVRGIATPVLPPLESMHDVWNQEEEVHVSNMLKFSAVGSEKTVQNELQEIVNYTDADELIFTSHMYEQGARLKTFEIAAAVMEKIEKPAK